MFGAGLRADSRCDVLICYPEGVRFLFFRDNRS